MWSLQRTEILRDVNCILLQHSKINYLECSGIGGCQHHRRRYSSFVRLKPALGDHTPPVARLQPRKAERGRRRDQVIADAALLPQEFRGHHRAHQMNGLIWSRDAAAIAVETRNRICAAALQLAAKDIRFTVHSPSLDWPVRSKYVRWN